MRHIDFYEDSTGCSAYKENLSSQDTKFEEKNTFPAMNISFQTLTNHLTYMKIYSFEKLEVWQEARRLAVKIYKVTRAFPDEEKFGISRQMRRAGISISSNIAEGTSRHTKKDQVRYYEIAYGSLMELLNQAIISSDLEFLAETALYDIRVEIDSISYKLSRLRDSLLSRE